MKVFGSQTSPFVRRVRLLLELNQIDYQFSEVVVFSEEGQRQVQELSPLRLIPLLQDGELVLSSSRTICEYLVEKKQLAKPSWEQQELVTVIDELNNTMIQLFLMQRQGVAIDESSLYVQNKHKRIADGLEFLEDKLAQLETHQYLSVFYFSLVDWIEFRERWNLKGLQKTQGFLSKWRSLDAAQHTDPRRA